MNKRKRELAEKILDAVFAYNMGESLCLPAVMTDCQELAQAVIAEDWVSVDERLPEDGRQVDVITTSPYGDGRECGVWFSDGKFWITPGRQAKVTHWNPSPHRGLSNGY